MGRYFGAWEARRSWRSLPLTPGLWANLLQCRAYMEKLRTFGAARELDAAAVAITANVRAMLPEGELARLSDKQGASGGGGDDDDSDTAVEPVEEIEIDEAEDAHEGRAAAPVARRPSRPRKKRPREPTPAALCV